MCAAKRSPLRTPIRWSKGPKAKKRRSAAFFLTLLDPSPFDPSGAKRNSMVVELKAPLCKGGSADRRWGIVTLPIHRTTLARPQSLRPCGAPPFTQGRLHGAMQASPLHPFTHCDCVFKIICRGGVGDAAPCNLALLQNLWFSVGADSISARGVLRLPQPYMLPKSRAIFPKLRTASL